MRFDISSALSSLRSREKRPPSRKTVIIIAVVASLLFAFAAGGIYGKYVQQSTGDGLVSAKAFYFESNVLAAPNSYGEYPLYELAAGTTSFSFNLENFVDDLRYAGYDITYDVVTIGGSISDSGGGKISGGSRNSSTITLDGLADGQTYTVTAKTTNGYYKILGAEFRIATPASGIYAYLDTETNSHFVELILWTENTNGTLTVDAPDTGLIPDTTKGVSVQTLVNLGIDESARLRYFRKTPGASFSLNDFTFSTTVTPGTPH